MPKLSSFGLTKITQENLQEKTRENDFEAVKEPSTSTGDITSTCTSPVNNACGNSSDDVIELEIEHLDLGEIYGNGRVSPKSQEFHSLTWKTLNGVLGQWSNVCWSCIVDKESKIQRKIE